MEKRDRLLHEDHDYDGIREYDNPLPNWWLYLFYGCIAFACLYLGFHLGNARALARATGGSTVRSWSVAELDEAARLEAARLAAAPVHELQGEELVAFLRNPQSISRGEALFSSTCVSCHGDQGQGVVGPNLTDDYWLHGWKPEDVVASISHGYPDKGMPSWKPVLGADKVNALAAYVLSLEGRKVANPKPPQGVKKT